MKHKKGLTLVEVIVAIALLGIIGVLVFPALTNQYSLLRGTRSMTADLYAAQQTIEQVISDTKKDIQQDIAPDGQIKTSYTLFSGQPVQRSVNGYPNRISVHIGNDHVTLNTVVADNRMPSFDVAVASNVQLRFYNGTSYLTNAYTTTPSLSVVSSFDLADPNNINLTNISRWYVSRQGFNSPMISLPAEIENGTVYPRFPEDYVLIQNVSNKNLTDIRTEYAGRHLIYTVTPASESGKMGTTVPSNPVFLSGLPLINGLVVHLDASTLSREDVNVVASSNRLYVKKWNDISGNNNNTGSQTTASKQPELLDIKTGYIVLNGTTYETYAKYVRFNGGQGLTIPNSNSINLNNLTTFVVARSTSKIINKTIIAKLSSGTGWFLGWNESNQLGMTIRRSWYSTNTVNNANAAADAGLDGNWHILTGTTGLTFQIDSTNATTTPRTINDSITNTSAGLTIGFDGSSSYSTVDIAEIIVFNRILTTDEQYKVNMYLKNKYMPDSPEINIYALKPISDSAVIGEPYTLPSTIKAYMTNGTMMDVAVTWSENPIITDTAGTKTSIATAISDPSKTTTATIDVAGILNLNDLAVTVTANDPNPYVLPTTVSATLTSGLLRSTAVTWNGGNINTQTAGTYTRIGTSTLDTSKTMTLTLTVVPRSVSGVTLSPTELNLNSGQSQQLTATVLPADAYNKTVTWSSSDGNIATVSETGLVTAVSGGNATITVTTADGNYTANCVVHVTTPVTGVTLNIQAISRPRNSVFSLTATVLPATASNTNVVWSSSNTDVATVSQYGVVTIQNYTDWWGNRRPTNGSTAIITVRTVDGGFTATCLVTVGNPVTGVSLTPTLILSTGQYNDLTPSFEPDDAINQDVTWSSSNPSVATVNSNGRVTGVSLGSTTITVTTVEGGFTANCSVTVVTPLHAISIVGDRTFCTITFDKPISAVSESISNTNASYSGYTVTLTRTRWSFDTYTDYVVVVTASDGSNDSFTARRTGNTSWTVSVTP